MGEAATTGRKPEGYAVAAKRTGVYRQTPADQCGFGSSRSADSGVRKYGEWLRDDEPGNPSIWKRFRRSWW